MNRKKLVIGLVLVIGLAAVIYANLTPTRTSAVEVNTEKVARHDLEAIVSASGKIRPQRSVNISAETMGKVVGLAVNEGDTVTAGQFLLQIDPRNLQTQVNSREASLAAARSSLAETRRSLDSIRNLACAMGSRDSWLPSCCVNHRIAPLNQGPNRAIVCDAAVPQLHPIRAPGRA